MMSQSQIDHRGFLRALSSGQRQQLTRKSDFRGFLHLACHASVIILLGSLIIAQIPFWPLLMVLQGVMIIFLFALLHETSHRTVFKTVWVNRAVAQICGFLIVLPADWFRRFHFEHHRHTQDTLKDPELVAEKPKTVPAYLLYLSGIPVWRSQVAALIRNASGGCADSFVSKRGLSRVRMEAQLTLLCYGGIAGLSIALGLTELLYVWVLPALLGQPFLRLYLLAEHAGCPRSANMFENSRTVSTPIVIRTLAWNMPFHAEHHAYPAVPFHKLPDLHDLARHHLQTTEIGYFQFHRNYLAHMDKWPADL